MRGVTALGFSGPTPVQRESFSPVMAGRDVIVQAKTGSGKTSAFGVPIVARLGDHDGRVRCLTLCPTRELASQVGKEIGVLGRHAGLRVVPIYGGAAFGPQVDGLQRGADVVVGTPGRVMDHYRRGNLNLDAVEFMVLDEADEMLSMGFWEEVTSILDLIRNPHQTLLFSATLPPAIQRAAAKYLHDPQRIELSGDELTVDNIANVFYRADERTPKPRNLLQIIEMERPDRALVFCNRKDETELVFNVLRRFGFNAGLINSNLSQREREWVMGSIKDRTLEILVATDVAARGIDISDLSHVFNYDLPEHTEVYVHRSGRTGRIGKQGTAVSLVRGISVNRLRIIARQFDIEFEERSLPGPEVIVQQQSERILSKLTADAAGVETSQYHAVAEALRDHPEATDAIAYLLRSYFSEARLPSQRQRTTEAQREHGLVRLVIAAGANDGLDVDTLRTTLAELAGCAAEAFEDLVVDADESSFQVDATTARTLTERAVDATLPDGQPLRLHSLPSEEPRRPPSRRRGPPGRGGGGGRRRGRR